MALRLLTRLDHSDTVQCDGDGRAAPGRASALITSRIAAPMIWEVMHEQATCGDACICANFLVVMAVDTMITDSACTYVKRMRETCGLDTPSGPTVDVVR
eukprot:CAMPEP_0119416878 /NCGR_PEP_ID=MMETSP1335-20130426/14375_1 /TAXON_ID=259385 /ORGANISM="Chrysoculter rhomboideus, Strain RCC1486" /LENGTH=99 /DNA_ID=CAMNT_0007442025 /DNA_START=455 /DNA_END=755 /DNA_ORIENTATION=-